MFPCLPRESPLLAAAAEEKLRRAVAVFGDCVADQKPFVEEPVEDERLVGVP